MSRTPGSLHDRRGGGGRIATVGRTRERRDPRRSPGRRKGFEAERRRSAGAPIPGTSSEARSEVTETARHRKARGQRRSNACGGGSPVGGGADANACWSGPTRRLPWQARPASEGGAERHEHNILWRATCRSSRPCAKRTATGHALLHARAEVVRGLLAPRLDRRTGSWRAVREGMGSPRYPASRSPSPTADTRSPPESQGPWREIRESLTARLIVTASRIGPMPERMSLNLMGSLPIIDSGADVRA
jgi:hypothetical protein